MRLDVLDVEGARVVHGVVLHEEQIRGIHRDCDAAIVERLDVTRIRYCGHAEEEEGDALRLEYPAVALFDDRGGDRRSVAICKALSEREDHLVALGLVALRQHSIDPLRFNPPEVDPGYGLIRVFVLSELIERVLNGRLRRLAADRERRVERVDIALDSNHKRVGGCLGDAGGRGGVRRLTSRPPRLEHADAQDCSWPVLQHIASRHRRANCLHRVQVFQMATLPSFHRYLPKWATASASGSVASCSASPKASSSSLGGAANPPILLGRQPSVARPASSSAYLNGATVASITGTPNFDWSSSKNPYSAVHPRTTTSAPSFVTASSAAAVRRWRVRSRAPSQSRAPSANT